MNNLKYLSLYLKEREGVESIENEYGFASYLIFNEECLIRDIWIKPEFRQMNRASTLADKISEIAKEKGCKILTGTVCPKANNSTTSLKVLLGYGMELYSSQDNLIIFKKDL